MEKLRIRSNLTCLVQVGPVSEKYANILKYHMDYINFFSTKTITVPFGFRLFAIAQLSLS